MEGDRRGHGVVRAVVEDVDGGYVDARADADPEDEPYPFAFEQQRRERGRGRRWRRSPPPRRTSVR